MARNHTASKAPRATVIFTKAKPAEMPVGRPTFQPCWTEAKAVEMANDHLAPNAVANAGYRLAMVILATPAEGLMKGALASSDLIHMAREESVLLRLAFDPTAMSDDGDAQ